MAWDANRPVPWRRLAREAAIFLVIGAIALTLLVKHRQVGTYIGLVLGMIFYVGFVAMLSKFGYQRQSIREARERRRGSRQSPDRRRQGRASTAGADPAHQHGPVAAAQPFDQEAPPLTTVTSMGGDVGRCVIAIDAGTTGVRSRAVFADGARRTAAYQEFTQIYPQPGWVEHDADEIWSVVRSTLNDVVGRVGRESVAAIGIANQRETVVAWNRRTGKPYGTAIVWQDRRTADRCEALREGGYLPLVRHTTGLVLDPYFSASKFEWLLAERDIPIDDRAGPGHDRLVADLEPHRRRGARHRSDQRQQDDAVRHPHAAVVDRAVRPVRRADVRTAVGAAVQRPLRFHVGGGRDAPPASRSRVSPATSRRPCSARRASSRAWPRTPTARAASCC